MNVIINLPELPAGYEYTGEFRQMEQGEFYLHRGVKIYCHGEYSGNVHIVRKTTKRRPMTAKEIAMLPRGTAFIRKGGDTYYNELVYAKNHAVYINGTLVDEYWLGYKLPTDSVDDPVRPFTVEE